MKRRRLPRTIAIDGPAASGKTTIGRHLAQHFGYLFLDTGLMYRAFALAALRAGVPSSNAEACERLAQEIRLTVQAGTDTRILIAGEDVTDRLRDSDVERSVSAYSAIPGVREIMVRRQRAIAGRRRSVVAGRDIGTVVLPDADLKFFLDASHLARAERRSRQSSGWPEQRGETASLNDITLRDRQDSSRTVSPLAIPDDAVYVDTTRLTLQEVVALVERALECVPD